MRCFLAIPLSQELSERIWQALAPLRRQLDWKWVRPENYHLTLNFLGEMDEKNLNVWSAQWQAAFAQHSAFSVRLAGLGTFPERHKAKVFWCGVDQGVQDWRILCRLAGNTEPQERLHPHVTLARNRSDARPSLIDRWIDEHRKTVWGEQKVQAAVLYQSQLRPEGPIYTVLKSFPLKEHQNEYDGIDDLKPIQ